MKQKIIFQITSPLDFLKHNKKRAFFNFLNLHDLYQADNQPVFKNSLLGGQNINFIDGFIISVYLSTLNFRKVSRKSGPVFTKNLLSNPKLSSTKKHFFIGPEEKDIKELQKKYPHLKNVKSYSPPYIKDIKFPEKEINKISKLINKEKPDYVWVGVGCPKQNILSKQLFKKTSAKYFMNVGAAIDFLLEKKRQAPKIIRNLGIEWLYRLVTDFKHSWKKVLRSFIGLSKLNQVTMTNNK